MILRWNYRELPIKLKHLLVVSILIVLAFWAQGGFSFQLNHTLFLIANYFVWFLLLPQVHQLVQYSFANQSKKWLMVFGWAVAIIASQWIISNIILSLLKYLILDQHMLKDWRDIASYLVPSLVIRVFDLALFSGLLYWLHQQRAFTRKQVEFAESQTLLHQSKLQSLKSQLNPHFLFNALHIINTQIGVDDKKAREMTLKISRLLRQLLAINQLERHTVEEEMQFVSMYLEIESERFSDRLTVHLNVDKQANSCVIPTMVLQPLIENAFKHGISKIEGSADLFVSIQKDDKNLTIEIKNPVPAKAHKQTREGIGLQNLKDRLTLYYDNEVNLETTITGNKFITSLSIPV